MSLLENIAFSEHISDEMIEKAVDTAELKSFVETLPDKLNTVVSERGTSLSGGQKQRVMLARALALNRDFAFRWFYGQSGSQNRTTDHDQYTKQLSGITLLTITQNYAAVEHYEQIILLMESEIIASAESSKPL